MARACVRSSSQYLEYAGAVATAVPITMACWARIDDLSVTQSLLGVYANGSATNRFHLQLVAATANLRAVTFGASSATATTSTSAAVNTWFHACAVFAATNDRRAFLNGGGKGTNAGTQTPTSIDRTAVGRSSNSTPGSYLSGRIAEVVMWNVALADAVVAALAAGVCPFQVEPASIIGYWPLQGLASPEPDWSANARSLTVTGATAADHAPVLPYWRRGGLYEDVAAAEAAGQPTMRRWAGVPHLGGARPQGRGW